ncbi:MAG: dCTP deaminase [Phycisphaerae bacterium]|nr:dCTP deaminase [Phycisphaerae bacterium]
MILTDHEIRTHIAGGLITIDPLPDESRYSATTVDLTLGPQVQEWLTDTSAMPPIQPGRPGYRVADVIARYTRRLDISDGYLLRPQQFILAWTAERVALPKASKIAARVEGKSSMARIAIGVHVCAPTIHPGFDARLQLEMCNHGTATVELLPGMSICQLIFETTLGTPDHAYDGQFKTQTPTDISGSR